MPYEPLLNSPWVTRLYLNNLGDEETPRLSVRILQLLVAQKKQIRQQVQNLVKQVEQEITSQGNREQVLDLIETIVLYKLPQISRQELGEMFSVENLKKTRFAQEMKQEGREEGREEMKRQLINRLAARAMSPDDIAEILELDPAVVQQILKSPEN